MFRLPALVAVLTGAVAAPARAQDIQFFYPTPPASSFDVTPNVAYGDLHMDVYRPANARGVAPVLILFNTVSGAERAHPFYTAWVAVALESRGRARSTLSSRNEPQRSQPRRKAGQ